MQYPVITSRPAQTDFANIVSKHADIVTGMTAQAQRVAMGQQQKSAEMQTQTQQEREMDFRREQMSRESEVSQREYDLKLLDTLKP